MAKKATKKKASKKKAGKRLTDCATIAHRRHYGGDPIQYGEEILNRTTQLIDDGLTSMTELAERLMVLPATLFYWAEMYPEFKQQFHRIHRPRGRPTKYHPMLCDVVIGVGAEGGWLAEMAVACGVSEPSTLDDWSEKHPEFSQAYKEAKRLSRAWFERTGRQGMPMGGGFNAQLWRAQMAARFPKDYTQTNKHQLTGAEGGPIKTITADMSPKEAAEAYAATLRNDEG
jgi:hypothetical protein